MRNDVDRVYRGGPGGINPDGGPVDTGGTYGGGGDWIGAAINAGAMLYDSYQNRKAAKQNTDKTLAANKAEAELAYQRQMEMWGLKNAYDSPAAQMQRFRDAGLSPHLAYGGGNPGNSGAFPQYQPPEQRYNYQAMQLAPGISSILPTLMGVGSWMQDMRLKEMQIDKGQTENERLAQLIEFLSQRNPQVLKRGAFDIDRSDYASNIARTQLFQLEQSFRQQYGEDLFTKMGSAWDMGGDLPPIGGTKRLEFLEKESKNRLLGYEEKLKEAQSSWADMDITNPQAIIMLVLQGIMGMAGAQLKSPRLSSKGKTTHEVEEIMKTGRRRIRRRIHTP